MLATIMAEHSKSIDTLTTNKEAPVYQSDQGTSALPTESMMQQSAAIQPQQTIIPLTRYPNNNLTIKSL